MAKNTPKPQRSRTTSVDAGEPQNARPSAARQTRPSDEELDRRDQMKIGPRRPAGPPLEGDEPEAAPLAAIDDDLLPEPTEPKD